MDLELVENESHEAVKPANLVVISGVVPAHQIGIRMIGREEDVLRRVRLCRDPILIGTVRVDGCEPEEKGLLWISFTQKVYPLGASAPIIARRGLRKLIVGSGSRVCGELET